MTNLMSDRWCENPKADDRLVSECWACPCCSERRIDWLANDDDDASESTIICGTSANLRWTIARLLTTP